jgi:hypothetical protein
MALGILGNFDLAALPPDSAAAQHLEIEAMKLAFADAHRYVSDPRTMPVPASALLDRSYLAARARKIDLAHAQDFGPGEPPKGGTVYLCAADQNGMMVSLIQSNMGFGSGVVVRGPASACRIAARVFAAARSPERGRWRQAAITRSSRRHDGRAAGGVRRAGVRSSRLARQTLCGSSITDEPQAVLDAPRRKSTRAMIDLEAAASPELRATVGDGSHDGRCPGFVHGFRRGPVHRQDRRRLHRGV